MTALVRQAQLPRALRCRPTAKLCLLALADRCNEAGEGAWPSLATIAAEAEVDDVRTVRARLASLQAFGLIAEQAPPTQQRPRTWRLNLDALDALARHRLPLLDPLDRQPVAPLSEPAATAGGQIGAPGEQIPTSGGQIHASGGQLLAPDPVLRSGPLNGQLNARAIEKPEGYGGDLAAARAVLRGLLTPAASMADVLAAAQLECDARAIDLGAESDQVLLRAYVLEHVRAKFAIPPRATIHSTAHRRRR